MTAADVKLTRIGVFYDGNFFFHVSNYYAYQHERRARLSIHGLHDFIRTEVAKHEGVDARYCQVVDAHYFRGRLGAREAESRALLLKEPLFDDVLINEGIVTHYLPLTAEGEKGIDVWLALEVLELAVYKRFSVAVLVTGDRDFVPLVRKLNTLGTRVMVMGWDFKYVDQRGEERETRTSQLLLNEATYPVLMSDVIDDRARRTDPMINHLFLPQRESRFPVALEQVELEGEGDQKQRGTLGALKEGYRIHLPPRRSGPLLFPPRPDQSRLQRPRDRSACRIRVGRERPRTVCAQHPRR
jgi:hypothetical protein